MRGIKTTSIVFANVFAILLLLIGLISPLTPSEGIPSLFDILFFAVAPLVILSIISIKVENKAAKLFIIIETIVTAALLVGIFGLVYKTA